MATVIRVKRPLIEEPEDSLVVNCKRQKADTGVSNNEESTVFKRTGTLNNKDDDIFKYIKESTKLKIEQSYKTHTCDLRNKIKTQNQIRKRETKYTIINLYRSIETTTTPEDDITVVDVETNNNGEKDFVYDLYCSNSGNLAEIEYHELISVYPLNDELAHNDNGYDNEIVDDDSDSNDENNWRNDYPDESDNESVTEDDMINAVNRVNIDQQDDLSSDAESFVYTIDVDAREYVYDME